MPDPRDPVSSTSQRRRSEERLTSKVSDGSSPTKPSIAVTFALVQNAARTLFGGQVTANEIRCYMISLETIRSLAVLSLVVVGCGSSSSAPNDGAISGNTCAAARDQQKSRTTALGCSDNSATIEMACNSFYSTNHCVAEWETLLTCITPKPNTDFMCDSDMTLKPNAGVCTSEQAAFNTCIGV
jgi:hypothetical protein